MAFEMKSRILSFSRKKKVVLVSFTLIIVIIIPIFLFAMISLRSEIIRDVETMNPDGVSGNAFVVYRPGISSFQYDITTRFIDGLIDNDWCVNVTTSSSETPTNLSGYDLLVIGSPTYGGKPHQSVLDYINRLIDLKGMDTAIIITAGSSANAAIITEEAINTVNGTVINTLLCYVTSTTGSSPYNTAYQAGNSIPIP